ncbi:MAG: hypothetical protein WAW61_13040 [Methylococcaceae bacterium]
MKNFIEPSDLPGKDSAPGKMTKYQRDVSAALSEADAKQITEARALLDELLYNSSPLHDKKHPHHERVKKAVARLEEELTRLTLDSPDGHVKPATPNRLAKN